MHSPEEKKLFLCVYYLCDSEKLRFGNTEIQEKSFFWINEIVKKLGVSPPSECFTLPEKSAENLDLCRGNVLSW